MIYLPTYAYVYILPSDRLDKCFQLLKDHGIGFMASSSQLDLLVSDTWLDTGIGYWYRYPMTRYYERLLDTRSS